MKARHAFFILAAVVLSWHLGERGLNEPDEGRCAGIAYEMYHSGDWLMPRLYERAHVNKPPLLYWISDVVFRAGGVNETTARLPAALAGFGTLLLTWLLARRLYNEEVALCAGLILLTSPLFFVMSRLIDPNMLLTFWTTFAVWAAVAWIQDGRKKQLWLFYLALAGSFMTKGPVGAAIVLLAFAGYGIRRASTFPYRSLWAWAPFLISAVLALSWFVAVAVRNPDLYSFFLKQELFNRYFTEEHHRAQPFYFYLAMIPAAVAPWIPALLRSIVVAARNFRTDGPTRLMASWILLPTIMFSLAGSKMPTYILPLLPPIAVLAAAVLLASTSQLLNRIQLGYLILLAATLPLVMFFYGQRDDGWKIVCAAPDAFWVAPALGAAVLACLCSGCRRVMAMAGVLACSFLFSADTLTRHELAFGPYTTTRGMAGAISSQWRPGDRVVLFARYPRGLYFYLRQPVSVPAFKFEIEIPSDYERKKDLLYNEPTDVYAWFDSTQRVFLVTNDDAIKNMEKAGHKKARVMYRDERYVVVRNF